MEDFDYRKYIKNNPLLKEELELYKIDDNTPGSIKKDMSDLENKVFAIQSKGGVGNNIVADTVKVWDVDGNEAKETDEVIKGKFKMGNLEKAYNVEMDKGKVVGVKKIGENLKEGITWENRKPGERLPTMEDYKEFYENKNPIKEYTPMDSEEFDDDIIDLENDPIFNYNTEIYVPPHVRGEDVIVRADAENYRLPVEFLVDMAEQFGDMGSDATSFVDEAIARFVEVGMAEAEKDKLYNWFDNIMYAQGTMSDPDDDDFDHQDALDKASEEGDTRFMNESFDFKKYIKNNPLLKENDDELKSIVRNTKVKGNLLDFEDAVKAKAKEIGLNVTDQEVEDAVEKHADAAIGLFEKTNSPLKEGITWENRKPGERLPTLEDYKEAYENKNPVKEGPLSGLLGRGGTFDKIDMDIMNLEEYDKIEYLQGILDYATEIMGGINDGSYYGLAGKKE